MDQRIYQLWLGLVWLGCGMLSLWPTASVLAWQPEVSGGTCQQSGQPCSGTIGNAGQTRDACCDPAQANLQTCASTNPCVGGTAYKWPIGTPVSWWINTNGMAGKSGYTGLTDQQIIDAMKNGWAAWQKPGCTAFLQSYQGTSTDLPTQLARVDRKTVMFLATPAQWAQMGGGSQTLAFTIPITQSGTLIDADIVYNPNPRGGWKVTNVARTDTDLAAVTAHEAGHAIGFAHSADQNALMFYTSKPGPFPGLSQDDINAVCYTYPGKCNVDVDCGSACLGCTSGKCTRKTIAKVQNLCRPCTKPADCGGPNDICVRMQEGNRCGQDCSQGGCCPDGYRCTDVGSGIQMCLPEAGKCPPVTCANDANCGPGEGCQNGTCQPKPVPADPTSCKSCTSNSNCGTNGGCFQFPDNIARCAQPCIADNFCPTGYFCQATSGGRYCFPNELICPCKTTTDCQQNETCRSGLCRLTVCKYGCPCSDTAPCDAPYQCLQTGQGSLCFQVCGGSAGTGSFPAGVPGSTCSGGSCSLGANCYNLSGGGDICMKPCTNNSSCTSTGGQCYALGGQNFCLCQQDSECLSTQACNKTVLGQAGGGACAPKSSAPTCESGYECKSAGSIDICQPKPSRNVGESCGGTTQVCLDNLTCVRTSSTSDSGVCIENCPQDQKCKSGGSCVIQGGSSVFCGCNTDSQCASGEYCNKIFGQVGICAKGTPPNCGNNTCDTGKGENCSSCPQDCKCPTGQTCNNGTCQNAAQGCGNNTCDTGENCSTCPQDCKCNAGTVCTNGTCTPPPKDCGNNTCERDKGEDCGTCPQDCPCDAGKVCENSRCVVSQNPCGNNTCERDKGEDCGTCPQDCKCDAGKVCENSRCVETPKTCGNRTCETNQGENCTTCPQDCACGSGLVCNNGQCQQPPQSCGNGTCDRTQGEGCGTCVRDCPCQSNQTCQSNQCITSGNNNNNNTNNSNNSNNSNNANKLKCPVDEQIEVCDTSGKNCALECATKTPKACGCVQNPQPPLRSPLFLLFVLGTMLLLRRRNG